MQKVTNPYKNIHERAPLTLMITTMLFLYLSLNTQTIVIPFVTIFRWILPFIILFISLLNLIKCNKRVYIPSIVFLSLFAILPSMFITQDFVYSFYRSVSFLLIIISTTLYFNMNSNIKQMQCVLDIFTWLMVVFEILSILSIIVNPNDVDSNRYLGITGNANSLGIFSVMAILSSYYLYKRRKTNKHIIFYFTLLVGSFFTSIASGSRSATVIAGINLVIILLLTIIERMKYLKKNGQSRYGVIFFIILVMAALYFIINNTQLLKQIPGVKRILSSGISRDSYWNNAIKMFKQKPWFGWGYAISAKLQGTIAVTGGQQYHNSYLTLLVEVGIIGFILINSFILGIVIKVFKYFINNNFNDTLIPLGISLSIIINLLISAYGESFMFSVGSSEGFIFWFLLLWVNFYLRKLNN